MKLGHPDSSCVVDFLQGIRNERERKSMIWPEFLLNLGEAQEIFPSATGFGGGLVSFYENTDTSLRV